MPRLVPFDFGKLLADCRHQFILRRTPVLAAIATAVAARLAGVSSHLLLILAGAGLWALARGYRVLIVSPEMSERRR